MRPRRSDVSDRHALGAELQVSADQEVVVVLPGDPLACSFEERVEAGPVDQPGPLAGSVAAHRGDRDASPGPSPRGHHGTRSAPAPRSARGGVIANPPSSSKRIPCIERRRGPFTCGHTSVFHSSTVCSSRSGARRAGLCQDQPWRSSSRHPPVMEQLIWNWRPISARTRSRVHQRSFQSCAAGP